MTFKKIKLYITLTITAITISACKRETTIITPIKLNINNIGIAEVPEPYNSLYHITNKDQIYIYTDSLWGIHFDYRDYYTGGNKCNLKLHKILTPLFTKKDVVCLYDKLDSLYNYNRLPNRRMYNYMAIQFPVQKASVSLSCRANELTILISGSPTFFRSNYIENMDFYIVHLPDTEESEIWDSTKFIRNEKKLYREYPYVKVHKIRNGQEIK